MAHPKEIETRSIYRVPESLCVTVRGRGDMDFLTRWQPKLAPAGPVTEGRQRQQGRSSSADEPEDIGPEWAAPSE